MKLRFSGIWVSHLDITVLKIKVLLVLWTYNLDDLFVLSCLRIRVQEKPIQAPILWNYIIEDFECAKRRNIKTL